VVWVTPQQFIAKWKQVDLCERSACQQHFLDLCDLLGQPKPAEVDATGEWFTFERGVDKTDGGKGFADVWMQGKFGWEYMGKHKNLAAAWCHSFGSAKAWQQLQLSRTLDALRAIREQILRGLHRRPVYSAALDHIHFSAAMVQESDFVGTFCKPRSRCHESPI
jgi:hypothetical protein